MSIDIKDATSVIEARNRRINHDTAVVESSYQNMRNKTFKDMGILAFLALIGVGIMVFGTMIGDGSALRNFIGVLLATWGFTVLGTTALIFSAKRSELGDIKYEREVFLKNLA